MSLKTVTRRLTRRAVKHVLDWGVNSALFWGVTAVFFGGIIHIAVIMSLPYLATNSAWTRLLPLTIENRMVPLALAGKGSKATLPLMTTDMRYAVCRYNLDKGPLLIQANLLDDHWSVAIYTRQGQNFYVINGRDLRRSEVELLLSTEFKPESPGKTQKEQEDAEDEGTIRVSADDTQGLVIIRAPLMGSNFSERADEGLKRAACNPQHQAETAAAK